MGFKPPLGFSADQIALFKNPTNEHALRYWNYDLLGQPASPDAPLAGIHKARIKWRGSTKDMVRESKAWLREHGYGDDPRGPSPDVPQAASIRQRN